MIMPPTNPSWKIVFSALKYESSYALLFKALHIYCSILNAVSFYMSSKWLQRKAGCSNSVFAGVGLTVCAIVYVKGKWNKEKRQNSASK